VADNKPVELAYHWVPTEQRPLYDAAVDSLSLDYCLKEIEQCSRQFLSVANMILCCDEIEPAQSSNCQIRIDTYIAELFYRYAAEGRPDFLHTYENGIKRELNKSDQHFEFGLYLSSFIAYNEIFTCAEKSVGGSLPAFSLIVVLNMFFARLKLDAARYSNQEYFLSIHEVSLLARMKEKSVRNFAHKSIGAFYEPTKRMTKIPALAAYEWLEDRRNFTASMSLETRYAQQLLVSIAEDFAN
jgi:hypothetical protein